MKKLLTALLLLIAGQQAFANTTPSDKDREVSCLALNIYHEARGEPIDGMLAVGFVTLNRVTDKYHPDTICEVVWEKRYSKKHKRHIAQFSWTLDGKSDKPKEKEAWDYAQKLATFLYEGNWRSIVDNALYYHADYIKPNWDFSKIQKVASIGKHIFYQ